MEKQKRSEWIDVVRGAGILGVIVFHTNFLPFIRISDPLLVSWILPVFPLTGGWLLKNVPFTKERLFRTTKRLLVPFFFSGIVTFLLWIVLRNVYPEQILDQPIGREGMKWLTGRNAYFNSPLWFIPTYLLASLFMQLIAVWWFRLRGVIQGIFSAGFITSGFLLSNPYTYPIYSYDLILLFIGMMMAGSIASKLDDSKIPYRIPIDLLILAVFVVVSLSNGYIDMFQREFRNIILYISSVFLGTYCVSRFVMFISRYGNILRYVSYLGKHSMTFLVWHWPIMQWFTYSLFVSGILQQIVARYNKTSFVIDAKGIQLFILQCVFCFIYTSVTTLIIFMTRKFLQKYGDKRTIWIFD